jgi:hypothetical protein
MKPFEAVVTAGRDPVTIDDALVKRYMRYLDENDDGHFYWTGAKTRTAGVLTVEHMLVDVRSLGWVIHTAGDIPRGLLPRPKCGKLLCIRPEHMQLVPSRARGRVKKEPDFAQKHAPFHGDTSPGEATLEELTPPGLQRLAHAQFGGTPPTKHTSACRCAACWPAATSRQEATKEPDIFDRERKRVQARLEAKRDAPTDAEKLAFLGQPGVAHVTYKSGATLVFHFTEQFFGMTFDEAVVNAIRGHA